MKRKTIFLKPISLILVGTFCFSEASYSASPYERLGIANSQKPLEQISQDPTRFEAPPDFSTLKEIHKGQNGTFIIHIQDAHSNFSGQQNLANTLDEIMKKYEVSLVLVEGGGINGTLDLLKKIAPPEITKRTAKRLLMEGEIAGEEYLNLISDHPMKIMGIEDMNLYFKSVENYSLLADKREAVLNYLRRIQQAADKLKAKLYPNELASYEKGKSGHQNNSFETDFKELLDLASSKQLDLTSFPNTKKLKALQDKEKTIDFNLANLEQAALIEEIQKGGGAEDLKDHLTQASRMKNQKLSQFAYFQNIFEIAKKKNVVLSKYPNFGLYGEYLKDFSALKLDQVLDELERLEDQVYKSFLTTQDQRLLRSVDRYLSLLRKAYSIQMSSKEFLLFQVNEPDFATISCLAFLNRKLIDLGYFEDPIPYQAILEDGKKALETFYESVGERDLAFIRNTEKILKEQNQKVAVLISGGYHTQNITKLFKDKGYSFVVLTPVVSFETDQKRYEKLLLSTIRKEVKKIQTVNGEKPETNKEKVRYIQAAYRDIVNRFAQIAGVPSNEPQVQEARDHFDQLRFEEEKAKQEAQRRLESLQFLGDAVSGARMAGPPVELAVIPESDETTRAAWVERFADLDAEFDPRKQIGSRRIMFALRDIAEHLKREFEEYLLENYDDRLSLPEGTEISKSVTDPHMCLLIQILIRTVEKAPQKKALMLTLKHLSDEEPEKYQERYRRLDSKPYSMFNVNSYWADQNLTLEDRLTLASGLFSKKSDALDFLNDLIALPKKDLRAIRQKMLQLREKHQRAAQWALMKQYPFVSEFHLYHGSRHLAFHEGDTMRLENPTFFATATDTAEEYAQGQLLRVAIPLDAVTYYGTYSGQPDEEFITIPGQYKILSVRNAGARMAKGSGENFDRAIDQLKQEIITSSSLEELNQILTKQTLTATDIKRLLSLFKQLPTLHAQYRKKPGVWEETVWRESYNENFTLERHTEMVLGQFERYLADYFREYLLANHLSDEIDIRFFRLFLTLHDIGKPLALEDGRSEKQQDNTILILEVLSDLFGFNAKQLSLAKALVDEDPIGRYLTSESPSALQDAIGQIQRIKEAHAIEIPVAVYFDLRAIYHQADASSYTSKAQDADGKYGIESLDELFDFEPAKLQKPTIYSPRTRMRFTTLSDALHAQPKGSRMATNIVFGKKAVGMERKQLTQLKKSLNGEFGTIWTDKIAKQRAEEILRELYQHITLLMIDHENGEYLANELLYNDQKFSLFENMLITMKGQPTRVVQDKLDHFFMKYMADFNISSQINAHFVRGETESWVQELEELMGQYHRITHWDFIHRFPNARGILLWRGLDARQNKEEELYLGLSEGKRFATNGQHYTQLPAYAITYSDEEKPKVIVYAPLSSIRVTSWLHRYQRDIAYEPEIILSGEAEFVDLFYSDSPSDNERLASIKTKYEKGLRAITSLDVRDLMSLERGLNFESLDTLGVKIQNEYLGVGARLAIRDITEPRIQSTYNVEGLLPSQVVTRISEVKGTLPRIIADQPEGVLLPIGVSSVGVLPATFAVIHVVQRNSETVAVQLTDATANPKFDETQVTKTDIQRAASKLAAVTATQNLPKPYELKTEPQEIAMDAYQEQDKRTVQIFRQMVNRLTENKFAIFRFSVGDEEQQIVDNITKEMAELKAELDRLNRGATFFFKARFELADKNGNIIQQLETAQVMTQTELASAAQLRSSVENEAFLGEAKVVKAGYLPTDGIYVGEEVRIFNYKAIGRTGLAVVTDSPSAPQMLEALTGADMGRADVARINLQLVKTPHIPLDGEDVSIQTYHKKHLIVRALAKFAQQLYQAYVTLRAAGTSA